MERYAPVYWGLDVAAFWRNMHACFVELLDTTDLERKVEIDEERIPEITIDPAPEAWPDPAPFVDEHEAP